MKNTSMILCFGGLLVGCDNDPKVTETGSTTSSDVQSPTTDTSNDGTDDMCTNSVVTTSPFADEDDVDYRDKVDVTMAAPDASATLSIVDTDGNNVDGFSSNIETMVSFEPTEGLAPNTRHTATLSWSCEAYSFGFTTSEMGTPVDVSALAGNSYSVRFDTGSWIEPNPIFGELMLALLDFELLLSVTEASDTDIAMIGALSAGIGDTTQDLCARTIEYPMVDLPSNPLFELETLTLPLLVEGLNATLRDVRLSGTLRPDGNSADHVALSGALDTRPLVPLLSADPAEESACALLLGFGVECEDCSDGSGPYCIPLHIERMSAESREGDPLVTRTEADIAADSDCAKK